MITWVVFLRMFWNFISSLPVKREGSLSFLTIFTFVVPELLDLMKIVKNERDPPLFIGKLLIKFQNILRNTTQVITRHRICLQTLTGEERRIPFIFDDFHFCRSRVIGLDVTENRIFTLCRMITCIRHRVKILFSIISSPITLERQKWKSSKMKGMLLSSPVSWW
jgi:hypothetical protein